MKVLITSYRLNDLVMYYVSEYIIRVFIPQLEKNGIIYNFLYEDRDTEENFNANVGSADIVILAGHGADDYITGYMYYPIVQACNNDGLLAGKKVCTVSCSSAKVLGSSAINKGALLYIGYLREAVMVFSYNVSDVRNAPIEQIDPLKDELAYPFLDTLFYPATLLVNGEDPESIYKETMDRYDYWINYALSKNSSDWSEVAKYLMWNKDSLAIYPVYTGQTKPQTQSSASIIIPFLLSAAIYIPKKFREHPR